jgi:uncharacterized membrane protein YoaK (UPF0700 family)
MPNFSSYSSILWTTAIFLIVVALGGSTVLLRKSDDKRLIFLSVLACLVALVFAPMLRAVPEEIGLRFFLIGLWPTLAIIAIAVVISVARFIQRRSKESLPSLVLSVSAVGLFYINSMTSLIWPYNTY